MATVYVSPTGSDSNTYVQAQSSSTPWLTIGKCNTSATTGDTIIVMAGTHTLANVTFTKAFTIQGATADPTLYIFSGNAGWTLAASSTYSISYVSFTGINDSDGEKKYLRCGGTTVLNMTNCIFYNSTGGDNNTFSQGGGGICIYSDTASNVVAVTNTLFYGISKHASVTSGAYISGRNGAGTTVSLTGCTLVSNTTAPVGAFLNTNVIAFTVKNCIFRDVKGASLDGWAAGSGGSLTASYTCWSGTTNEGGTGSITSDPLFVDEANNNFNLRPASPCIDTGTLV